MRKREQNFFWELWQRPKYLIMPNLFLSLVLVFGPASLQAADLPTGADVTAGSATVTNDGQTMTITQTSQNTSINFDSYSIGQGNTVQYIQPNASSVALNRVVGQDPSQILGNLNANGIVYLLNPNGVLFGQTARVDVAGLGVFACDGSLGADGSLQLGSMQGNVVNEGNITVRDFIRLVGLNVTNQGQLSGKDLSLLAGKEIDLGEAAGGKITLEFETDEEHVVKNEGTIDATGAEGGSVNLEGVQVGQFGTIHADGIQGDGGEVNLLADDTVAFDSNSLTTANGGSDGDGGSVTAIGQKNVLFRKGALIEAKGGLAAGDGGFVEVSGYEHIEVDGLVNASAVNGEGGTFLIDPTNIFVVGVDTATADSSDDITNHGDGTFTPNMTNFRNEVLDTVIEGYLENGINVILHTNNDSITGTPGHITVNATINKNAGTDATLTLEADGNIIINQKILSTSNLLNLDLNADGAITFKNSVDLNGGALNISGKSGASAGAVSQSAGSIVAGATAIDAGDNNITLRQAGNDFSSFGITSGKDVTITDANSLVLDASTVSGRLDIATSGNITQSGALDVNGATTLASSADHNITLNNAGNNFSSVGITSSNDVAITDANALVLSTTDIGGALDITTSGNITQSTPMIVGGATKLAAGSNHDITLNNAANDFSSISIGSGNIVSITDANALEIMNSTVSDKLEISTAGNISQSGTTNVHSVSYSGGNVFLNSDIISSGEVQITAVETFEIAAGNRILVIDGEDPVTIKADSITLSAGIAAGKETLTHTGQGGIHLTAPSIYLDKYTIRSTTGAETISLDATGGSITVADTPGEYEISGSKGLLDVRGNDIGAEHNLEFRNCAQLSIVDTGAGAIKLKELNTSSLTSLNSLDFTVVDETCGTIDLTLGNGSKIDIDDAHTLTDIDLSQGDIDFSYAATFGNIQVENLNILNSVLELKAEAGSITQSDAATAGMMAGVTLLTATNGDIRLTNAGNIFGDLEFRGNSVSITENDAIIYGHIKVEDYWNTTGATTLDAGDHDITLTNPTALTGSLTLTGRNITINRTAAVDISGTVSGDLSITSAGKITTDNGTLTVDGDAKFRVSEPGNGQISLTNFSATKIGAETKGSITITNSNSSAVHVEYLKAGGDITFTQQGGQEGEGELTLGVTGDGGDNSDIESGGDITISSTGTIIYQSNLSTSKPPETGGDYFGFGTIQNNGFNGLYRGGIIKVTGYVDPVGKEHNAVINTGGELDTQQTYFVHQNGRNGLSEFVELGGAKISAENPTQWPFDPNREIRTSGEAYRHSVKFEETN